MATQLAPRHTKETDTEFTHEWAPDPANATPDYHFDDPERRALDLETFSGTSCFTSPLDLPSFASH